MSIYQSLSKSKFFLLLLFLFSSLSGAQAAPTLKEAVLEGLDFAEAEKGRFIDRLNFYEKNHSSLDALSVSLLPRVFIETQRF